jgi:hypothetical protein
MSVKLNTVPEAKIKNHTSRETPVTENYDQYLRLFHKTTANLDV